MKHGTPKSGEKPDGTITIFGAMCKYNFSDGFPLITVRDLSGSWEKIHRAELLWFISGSTKATDLEEKFGSKLWNKWAKESEEKIGTPPGELGPIYGHQFRNWNNHLDQLSDLINLLKSVPDTRRGVLTFWNPDEVNPGGVKKVNVANCITQLHFSKINYQVGKGKFEPRLDMTMVQRSADVPAGVPHDLAEYALLQMLVAVEMGLPPGTLTHFIDEAQIYDIQKDAVIELLKRKPLPLPTVTIKPGTIFNHKAEDFELHNYQHHPYLKIPVAL
jgi:thymidylate synthase